MNRIRFWIAFIVLFIISQTMNFLIHGVWLDPAYAQIVDVFRPRWQVNAMNWVFTVTGAVVVWMFCFIFTRGYEGRGLGEGIRYGLYMGLFVSILAFDSYALYPLPYDMVLTWFLSSMAVFVVMGAALAMIYRPQDATTGSPE